MMKIILAVFLVLILIAPAHSETIKLKNGKTIDGRIIEKTDEFIKIYFSGMTLTCYLDDIENIDERDKSFPLPEEESRSSDISLPESRDTLYIKINPMIELDFKTKKEIYDIRRNYVLQYPELAYRLVQGQYVPSEAVFGQIEDNKAWWGILGQSYYGPGNKIIDGPSEESRFLINPFLLVGLDSGVVLTIDDKSLSPIEIFPEPLNLDWNTDSSFARVKYNVSSFWLKHKRYHDSAVRERGLNLIGFNARDFGFNYLYVDSVKSKNVLPIQASSEAVLIKQYIHCAGNCGYPGGCNNMSPEQPELKIRVDSTPACIHIKLWRDKPQDIKQPADMVFVIEAI